MKLSTLAPALNILTISGDTDIEVTGISVDNRMVEPGHIFIAVKGGTVDGNDFVELAIESGAVAIISERPESGGNTTWIQVKDARAALGKIAAEFSNHPSKELKLVGITGTNGKTTTTFILQHIMTTAWRYAGLIGTLVFDDGETREVASHTTPGAEKLQPLLRNMIDHGCRGAAMEVSSQGLHQGRVDSTEFAAGVFTNFSQDHLDYHGTLEEYYQAKRELFVKMARQGGKRKPAAIINTDDEYGVKLAKEFSDSLYVITFGQNTHADVRATQIRYTFTGTQFNLSYKGKHFLVRTPYIGEFNVMNCMAAITASIGVGIKPRVAVESLAEAPQVPGRLELVERASGTTIFVDYAHTPDAIKTVCDTLRTLEPTKLITVFGCGGDRDRAKRPLMGRAATLGSDLLVVTSDNPRTEHPEGIIEDIKQGLGSTPYHIEENRSEAIKLAVDAARDGDIILIAGKGHETYQEVHGTRHPFDDKFHVRRAIVELKKERIAFNEKRDAEKAEQAEWDEKKAQWAKNDRQRDILAQRDAMREEAKRKELEGNCEDLIE